MTFADGTRVTPGSEGCHCDEDGRVCEFPCWQRIGLTAEPCCPNCAPLPEPEPEPMATVTRLAFDDQQVSPPPNAGLVHRLGLELEGKAVSDEGGQP